MWGDGVRDLVQEMEVVGPPWDGSAAENIKMTHKENQEEGYMEDGIRVYSAVLSSKGKPWYHQIGAEELSTVMVEEWGTSQHCIHPERRHRDHYCKPKEKTLQRRLQDTNLA
jgi:hypothetical protein